MLPIETNRRKASLCPGLLACLEFYIHFHVLYGYKIKCSGPYCDKSKKWHHSQNQRGGWCLPWGLFRFVLHVAILSRSNVHFTSCVEKSICEPSLNTLKHAQWNQVETIAQNGMRSNLAGEKILGDRGLRISFWPILYHSSRPKPRPRRC